MFSLDLLLNLPRKESVVRHTCINEGKKKHPIMFDWIFIYWIMMNNLTTNTLLLSFSLYILFIYGFCFCFFSFFLSLWNSLQLLKKIVWGKKFFFLFCFQAHRKRKIERKKKLITIYVLLVHLVRLLNIHCLFFSKCIN